MLLTDVELGKLKMGDVMAEETREGENAEDDPDWATEANVAMVSKQARPILKLSRFFLTSPEESRRGINNVLSMCTLGLAIKPGRAISP